MNFHLFGRRGAPSGSAPCTVEKLPRGSSCARDPLKYEASVSRISSAVLVHTNGLGSAFHVVIQSRMSVSRAGLTGVRPTQFAVGQQGEQPLDLVEPGSRSGCGAHGSAAAASQLRITGVLWVA